MPKINATKAARGFSDLLNKVKYHGQSYEIVRGREAVARIVPAGPLVGAHIADLNRLFDELPRLQEAEREAFENDLRAIRTEAGDEVAGWG